MEERPPEFFPKEAGYYWARYKPTMLLRGVVYPWIIVGVSTEYNGSPSVYEIGKEKQYDFTGFKWGDKIEKPT